MKHLSLLLTFLVTACSPQPSKHETTMPIALGETRKSVNQKLGQPNIAGTPLSETYFAHGIVVTYTNDNVVQNISCAQLRSGTTFNGKVFGVSLGDPIANCTSLWGNPERWEEMPFEYSKAFYRFKDNRIELEVWNKDGFEPSFGNYKRGTIKSLLYAKHPNG